jgi:hypothetical protein
VITGKLDEMGHSQFLSDIYTEITLQLREQTYNFTSSVPSVYLKQVNHPILCSVSIINSNNILYRTFG